MALAAAIAAPAPVWAYGGGGPGCSNLPEYDRAIGALQGLSVCDMTIEQARRVVAAHNGAPLIEREAPTYPRRRHRAVD